MTAEVFRRSADVLSALADLVWPGVCPGCGDRGGSAFCEDCSRELLTLIAVPHCRRCGASLGPNVPQRDDGCSACPAVLGRWEQVVRLGPYTGPLRRVIRQAKFRRQLGSVTDLSDMLAERIRAETHLPSETIVMPVAMHWRRRLRRGCDLAEIIARRLARRLKLDRGDQLLRVRNTPPQTSMSRTQRKQNVRDAFSVRHGAILEGETVLLVDDVTTTGATADEAVRTLRRAGVAKVILAVFAKAEPVRSYDAYRRAADDSPATNAASSDT